ncbi:carbohydrate ABC transporter permease [Bauldia sp.]|uniref:carbohydrate ABC transporter permease n=1 Tax=Bauldia sp. TaxID=2575872 RepID=UPI003BAB7173
MATLAAREARAGYLFLLPAYLLYLLFLAIPLVASLGLSFYEVDRLKLDFTFVGFENFDWIFTDPRFWRTFQNTFFFISMSVIGNVGTGLLLAVALDRAISAPVLYTLRLAYFLPVLVSLAFVSFIWKFLFSTDLGAINYYLRRIGIGNVGWLTDADVAMYSVIIIDVWKNVGFFIIIFLAALQGVPRNLLEAAAIDGAKARTVMLRIKIPFIAPVILFCVTYATIGGLQVFDSIRILTNGGPGDATRSVVMYMVSEAFSAGQLGTGSASALTLLIVITVVVALQMGVARLFLRRM